MRLFLSVIFLLFLGQGVFAQPGVSPVIEKQGHKYYEHTVESGQTLYGLQRMYQVSTQEILKANPSMSESLSVGQKILIPVKEVVKEESITEYTVDKGETLYGISKKFNTTVDHLIELNPELSEGLKKGQVIKVPGEAVEIHEEQVIDVEPLPNPFVEDTVVQETIVDQQAVTFNDSIVRHKVLAHETMYSISRRYMVTVEELMKVNDLKSTTLKEGQVLTIPLKKERIDKVEIREVRELEDGQVKTSFDKKDRYKVVVLLPLYLDYGPGYSEYVSNLAAQFYMGVEMAIDSLKRKGLNADVFVYDTRNDSASVVKLINDRKLSEADLVIGPFFEKNQKLIADYCKKNDIRMVCPVITNPSVIENNPYVYAGVPSNLTLINGTARYVLENHKGDNIILIKTTKESDKPLYESFLKTFKETPVSGTRPSIVEVSIDDLKAYIRKGVKNIFIVPTNDKNTAIKFMNSLNRSAFRASKDDIYVFGTQEWLRFSEVSNIYKNKYNFHFAGPYYLDYYTDEMIEMNKKYRELYKTDFSKHAVQGYDIMTYFCSSFFLGNDHPFLLMNDFEMKQVSPQDGFENKHVYIIEQEEYELIQPGQKQD